MNYTICSCVTAELTNYELGRVYLKCVASMQEMTFPMLVYNLTMRLVNVKDSSLFPNAFYKHKENQIYTYICIAATKIMQEERLEQA